MDEQGSSGPRAEHCAFLGGIITLEDGRTLVLHAAPLVHITDDALIKGIVKEVGEPSFNSIELKNNHTKVAGVLKDIIGGMSGRQISPTKTEPLATLHDDA